MSYSGESSAIEEWNAESYRKPDCFSPISEKEIFIWNKYVEKKFMEKRPIGTRVDNFLWNSIYRNNIKLLLIFIPIYVHYY